MPTERHGKVRRLLKERKAKVVKKTPFTIQLLYDSTRYTSYCHSWSRRWFQTHWS
ncbi:RRXRR domain-containing protein [Allobaculum sp. JKK-2023]|uniref:RRXRR domain-containing protein n=1 Tax=Allobaculum sp. JKK-2023 TaxID=3108943 RepID=UPI003A5992F6